mmetsp:Transcript_10223/g.30196  ORF Transcript_10223/g.30196 Transcript_10223/m.30196 type:complete len:104 (-) Transcript_10223:856-1167(-)
MTGDTSTIDTKATLLRHRLAFFSQNVRFHEQEPQSLRSMRGWAIHNTRRVFNTSGNHAANNGLEEIVKYVSVQINNTFLDDSPANEMKRSRTVHNWLQKNGTT